MLFRVLQNSPQPTTPGSDMGSDARAISRIILGPTGQSNITSVEQRRTSAASSLQFAVG